MMSVLCFSQTDQDDSDKEHFEEDYAVISMETSMETGI